MAMMPFNLSVFLTARCWLLRRLMSGQSVSAKCDCEPDHHRRIERAGTIGDMLLCALVDHDNINFFSNRPLAERLDWTITTPEQVAEAMRLNEEARRIALQDRLVCPGFHNFVGHFSVSPVAGSQAW
jgi:hypothetical protein